MQKLASHGLGFIAENFLQHRIGDEGPGVAVVVECDATSAEFVNAHGDRRYKMSQDALDGISGNGPNTEKAEDMVNAKGIKIATHLRETAFPPRETVFL